MSYDIGIYRIETKIKKKHQNRKTFLKMKKILFHLVRNKNNH